MVMPSLFSLVERGGTHPLAVGPCEPRPLAKDGKIRPARRQVPQRTWARPADRFAGQPERRQPNRRSGRTQDPDATPASLQHPAGRAGTTIHSLPADYVPVKRHADGLCAAHRTSRSGSRRLGVAPSSRYERAAEVPTKMRIHTTRRLSQSCGRCSPQSSYAEGPGGGQSGQPAKRVVAWQRGTGMTATPCPPSAT
jgi:hypothetical protein